MFAVFTKQELEFNFKNDFNATGEFHGVVLGIWNEQKKLEPTFGTYANRAQFDEDTDTKVRLAHTKNCSTHSYLSKLQKITQIL